MTDIEADRIAAETRKFVEESHKLAAKRAKAAYRDAAFPERPCDRCGKPYRGPAVYCSLACALADA